ncbi:peroxisomal membrane protein 11A-like [Stegodyphus dumicola]|uniref:peroxisomal membrane protein 11A-like n=1 Tax=Stegodyphus dumicola TaxID=202533 RepID=UPI0015AED728|nr:peroxisomal membrane protein 11A-like [Stegodyphus dumicola]
MASSVMDTIIKLNNQSSGRDKIFRLVQYSSRLIWASLENKNSDKELINQLKNLEYSLSTGRKLYRFGRSLDTFYAALNTLHLDDPVLRFSITLSKINMAMYLFTDHIIWLGRVGLLSIDKEKWSKLSYKLWLYYLTMNLTRDFYEIMSVMNNFTHGSLKHDLQASNKKYANPFLSQLSMLYRLLRMHKDLALDTVKNGCDICLPLAELGYLSIHPRTVGLLGMISSVAGMLPLLDSSYKLVP